MTWDTTSSMSPPFVSVGGGLVAGVSLQLGVLGEGRLHVGHTGGIGCVSGRGVGGGVVGGGGVGWRVRGVEILWRLRVGWDGNLINTTAETTQGKVSQDSLHNKNVKVITVTLKTFPAFQLITLTLLNIAEDVPKQPNWFHFIPGQTKLAET